ncbi:uncharacterized protein LOC117821083 isoform X2 [Notolabrus celidotus]|nr:uncharacterized protein LOC117821083 isoform X2 [Notolabrus celidotus]
MDLSVAVNVASHSGGRPNRNKLLAWLNRTLRIDFIRLDQVCTGAAFCQLMDWCFPGSVDLSKICFESDNEADSLLNFQMLQAAFRKVGVLRYIPIKTLVEKNTVVGLAFLHWFKQFFDKNRNGRKYNPVKARGGQSTFSDDSDADVYVDVDDDADGVAPLNAPAPVTAPATASLAPHQTPEMNRQVTPDVNMEEAQSKETEMEDLTVKANVIDLISDEDDIINVTIEQEPEKMETNVIEGCSQPTVKTKAAMVDKNQRARLKSSDAVLHFIRRYCVDTNSNTDADTETLPAFFSPTHVKDIIQASCHTPYCLYLFIGVELGDGLSTSVVLVGYFDKNTKASVVRPLFTLQMSVDTPEDVDSEADAGTQTRDTDTSLLIDKLKKSGLRSSNLAMVYCNAPNPHLCQELVSTLQLINSRCVSLCGLPGMAERACQAALLASFRRVVDLVQDIHRHYCTYSPLNQNLKHIFADARPYNPSLQISEQSLFITLSVQRMVKNWRALVDYFKTVKITDDVPEIRIQLMDHKVKLHFLFLAHALQPLRALQELQQQDTADVGVQLKMAAVLFSSYASSLLVPIVNESFIKTRDLQVLQDGKNLLSSSRLDIGPIARDFLWATAEVDLGEQERKDFISSAMTFYKVALKTLAESIPKQLGDQAMKNISIMLKHPEDPKDYIPRSVVSLLAYQMGLSVKEDNAELVKNYFSTMRTVQNEQLSGAGGGQSWPKLLRYIRRYPILNGLILTLLALPSSLQRNTVFAKVRTWVDEIPDIIESIEIPKASAETSRGPGRPLVRRRRPSHASHASFNIKVVDETSSEEEEKPQVRLTLQIPPTHNDSPKDSDYTDNSSDVVDITEGSTSRPSNRMTTTERPGTPPAETYYIVGEDGSSISTIKSAPPTYLLGELVWAVMDGFATWPATISSKDCHDPKHRMVWWYGQSIATRVSTKDLKPFAAFAKHFCANSFAVLVTYREALFMSLQEAALRSEKQFSVDQMNKEEQLKQMLDWAFGGFLPKGPDGFKPTGDLRASRDTEQKTDRGIMGNKKSGTQRPKVKKKLFKKANSASKTADEEEFDSSERTPKGITKSRGGMSAEMGRQGRGEREAEKEEFGRGLGRGRGRGRGGWRGGKVPLKKTSEGFDSDRSPDFVPFKKRAVTKPDNKTSSVYTQPDQKLREAIICKIMVRKLDIEDFCLCCATKDVEICHPLFKGSLCTKCKNNLTETLYRYDEDGYQSYCTICCYGMEVILCGNNSCSRSYCTDCLNILIRPGTFDLLKAKDPWICFLCQPHRPHGALVPREDWSIRVQELFANNSAMEFEPHRVYPSIPANLRRPIRVLSLFDGIATGYVVLKDLGFKVETYVASEVCEDSLAVAAINHEGNIIHVGDARFITERQLEQWGPFDLLIGGSPCNDLSIVNPYRKGIYEGTGRLFFDYYRILQLLKPKEEDPRPFFWFFENVVFMNTHDKVNICRFLECNPVLVDAVNVSPAHRARCFWGNIPGMSRPITAYQSDKLTLQDCLEIGREAQVTKIRTITTNRNSLKQGRDVSLLPVLYNGKEDILWITEIERIFGFPKHYTDVRDLNKMQRQKVLGKAWSVPVVRHLFAPLKDYFACEELPPMTNSSNPSTSTSTSGAPSPGSPASPDSQMR